MFLFVNYEIEADLPHNKQEMSMILVKLKKCLAEVFQCP